MRVALDEKSDESEARCSSVEKSNGMRRGHCGAGLSEVSIDPEGWVYPCRLLQKTDYRVGNVRERRLSAIFIDNPQLATFRRPFVDTLKPCTSCIIKYDCGGGCRGIHSSFSGDWAIAEPLFCAQLRRSFETKAFASTGSLPPRESNEFIRVDGSLITLSASVNNGAFIPVDQLRLGNHEYR